MKIPFKLFMLPCLGEGETNSLYYSSMVCSSMNTLVIVIVKLLSRVRLSGTPWTAAHQAPPSMGFPRQEYWSGLPLYLKLTQHCKSTIIFKILFKSLFRENDPFPLEKKSILASNLKLTLQ